MAAEKGQVIACHTKEEFDNQMKAAEEAKTLVVIDFTASWCGPCRIIAPVFAELAKSYPHVVFLKVDVDELKEVAAEYKVEAMPTFLLIKEGKEVHKIVGARKDDLLAKVAEHGGGTASA
ncbi:hypothetical protein SEVIR_2G065100v4 [Setaria viridis]|uniref:Thioredoxin n=1 Tax=Setaria viridis TaxID=4556 RepID=A0A4U6VP10_SETVI|nr:thioredoxin H-type-like [Setaria viridis]TKW30852.1 hypothetical protein SEVIR_2G065100v2 [Setaria viridis]